MTRIDAPYTYFTEGLMTYLRYAAIMLGIGAAVAPAPAAAQAHGTAATAAPAAGSLAVAAAAAASRAFEVSLAVAAKAADRSGTIVSLRWQALSGARGYRVLRGHTLSERFVEVTPRFMDAAATAVDVAGLIPATNFLFRVVAVDAGGHGLDTTGTVTVHTPADASGGLALIMCRAVSPSTLQLFWAAVPQATGYVVDLTQMPTGNTPSPVALGTMTTTDTTYTQTGIPAGDVRIHVGYVYKIRDWPTPGDSVIAYPTLSAHSSSTSSTVGNAATATFPVTGAHPANCRP